jgi:hypothetical protein
MLLRVRPPGNAATWQARAVGVGSAALHEWSLRPEPAMARMYSRLTPRFVGCAVPLNVFVAEYATARYRLANGRTVPRRQKPHGAVLGRSPGGRHGTGNSKSAAASPNNPLVGLLIKTKLDLVRSIGRRS